MNEEKNLANMERCPRFRRCSAPLCPLDIDMDKRVEYSGEPRCPLMVKLKTKKNKELVIKPLMDAVRKYVPTKNRNSLR